MNYNKHLDLVGKHAFLGASKSSWINKDAAQILDAYAREYAASIGTALHDVARKHIQHRIKLTKAAKKEVFLSVVEDYHIPAFAVENGIDFDAVFDVLVAYVNDAIGFRMVPEQILYYSDNCFGTADAISNLNGVLLDHKLRIHDLKTGVTPVHIEQLYVYVALFCLEYKVKPIELEEIDLRIYQTQRDEVLCANPELDEIVPIMDKIVTMDNRLNKIKEENWL